MALKIKAGSVIAPYGHTGNSFDENSALSQPVLEHLQTRFPEHIEDDSAEKPVAKMNVAELQAACTEKGIEFDPAAKKADLVALLTEEK